MVREAIIRKNQREISLIREAGRIVAATLRHLAEIAQPGVTTKALDEEAERMIRNHGAFPTFKGYGGFPASVCLSVNEQVVHGIPSNRKLKEGDILGVDCGATLDGYVADAALTVAVGRISAECEMLMETTRRGLEAGIRAAVVGNRVSDISNAIERVANEKKYGIVREFCGHGVGIKLHEPPHIPNFGPPHAGPELQEGMTFAIEPMFNLGTHQVYVKSDGWTVVTADGKPSAHFEHTVAITADGPVIMTVM